MPLIKSLTWRTVVLFSQVIFKANDGIQIFVDNVLQEGQEPIFDVNRSTALTSGHIVLGRYLANVDNVSFESGELSCDWLTIWDRPLTDEERNLVYQN